MRQLLLCIFLCWFGITINVHCLDSASLTWNALPSTGTPPPAAYGLCASVSSSATSSLFVFGGFGDDRVAYNDLYKYDPISSSSRKWTLVRARASPSVRGRCMLWGDVENDNMFLYGGKDFTLDALSDMYLFNATQLRWVGVQPQTSQSGPGERAGSVAFYFSQSVLGLFGGKNISGHNVNDVWAFDTTPLKWGLVVASSSAPPTISGEQCGAQQEGTSKVFVFAARDGVVHVYDTVQHTWSKVATAPSTSNSASATCGIIDKNLFVIYLDGASQVMMLSLSTMTWKSHPLGRAPVSRPTFGAASSSAIALVGGLAQKATNAVTLFTSSSIEQQAAYVSPPPLAYHTATLSHDKIVLFGGLQRNSKPSAQTWFFDTTTVTWSLQPTSNNGPAARFGHAMFHHGHDVYIFGGCGSASYTQFYSDVHMLTPDGSWSQVLADKVAPVAPRAFSAMTVVGSTAYLYGGISELQQFGDLWSLDEAGKTWRQLRPSLLTGTLFGACMSSNSTHIMIAGGVSERGTTSNRVLVIEIATLSVHTFSTVVSAMAPGMVKLRNKPLTMAVISGAELTSYVPAGAAVSIIRGGSTTHFPDALNRSMWRSGSSAVLVGHRVYMFGGFAASATDAAIMSTHMIQQDMVATSDVFEACPPGTFLSINKQCDMCPAGHFSAVWDATVCVACPAGHYQSRLGSTDVGDCDLCPEGTYSPNAGTSTCTPCPPHTDIACPKGSTTPILKSSLHTTGKVNVLSPTVNNRMTIAHESEAFLIAAVAASAGTLLIFFVVRFSIPKVYSMIRKGVAAFDILCSDRHDACGTGYCVNYPTYVGGSFCISATLFVLLSIVSILVVPLRRGDVEDRAMIPTLMLPSEVKGDVGATFEFPVLGGACDCSKVSTRSTGIAWDAQSKSCQLGVGTNSGSSSSNCTVQLSIKGFSVVTASALLRVDLGGVLTDRFRWQLETQSTVDALVSHVQSDASVSSSMFRFNVPSSPLKVSMFSTPMFLTDVASVTETAGWHFSFVSQSSPGETSSTASADGFAVEFAMSMNNVVEVVRHASEDYVVASLILSVIAGTIGAVFMAFHGYEAVRFRGRILRVMCYNVMFPPSCMSSEVSLDEALESCHFFGVVNPLSQQAWGVGERKALPCHDGGGPEVNEAAEE